MLIKNESIVLSGGEAYYTHHAEEAYRVVHGAAAVYMVPYTQEERLSHKICIFRMDEQTKIAVPGFSVTDTDGEHWIFAIEAMTQRVQLMRDPCQRDHQKDFLRVLGMQCDGNQSFEECFFARYCPDKRICKIEPLTHILDEPEKTERITAINLERTTVEEPFRRRKQTNSQTTLFENQVKESSAVAAKNSAAVGYSTVIPEDAANQIPEQGTGKKKNMPRTALQEQTSEESIEEKKTKQSDSVRVKRTAQPGTIVIGDGIDVSVVDNKKAYVVKEGAVYVFLQPVMESGGKGLKQNLCEIDAKMRISIPGIRYAYDGKEWCISITAKSGDAVLKEIPSSPDAERRFVQTVQNSDENNLNMNLLEEFRRQGFAACMIQYYTAKKTLADTAREVRQDDQKKRLGAEIGKVIHGGVTGSDIVNMTGSEAYRALRYLCRKGGIKLLEEEELKSRCSRMTLPEIARASHFICREIILDADWYKSDCGLLMCTLEDHSVACIPIAGGGYHMYDEKSGREIRLTRDIARRIHPKAYSIRRSLPAKRLKFNDLFAFVGKGIFGKDIFFTVVLGALCLLVSILLPYLNQKIYDDYIPMGDTGMLLQMCMVIGTFMLGNIFFTLVKKLYEFRISTRVSYELQDAIIARVFELPESFLRRYESGDLTQRIQSFGAKANQLVNKVLVTGIASVLALLYLFQMVHYAKKLVLGAVLMVVIYGLMVYFVTTLSVRHEAVVAEKKSEAAGRLQQYLTGVHKIRMAGAEQYAILQYIKPVAEQQQAAIRAARVAEVGDVLRDAGSTIFSMVLYFLVIHNKIELSTGNFIAFNTAFGSLSGAILDLVNDLIELRCMKPELDMLKPVIESVPETDLDKTLDTVTELKGGVAMEHVTFSYIKDGEPVLRDISMRIKPGEYVGLVGRSGCGKSTIFKLLLGFETPQSGRVLYDDKDLRSLDKRSLRKRLGVVLQNGSLISGSIYDNIVITSENPSRKVAEVAVEKVGLKEDIAAMPMHLDTMINESAGTISGGQKQRILIARAIAGNPNVLLFDEATSALDNITQAKICESLDQMNVTRIVIAHRLSTIEHCDRIIVLDKGEIKEEGTYKELYARKGLFYEMARRQIAGAEENEQ